MGAPSDDLRILGARPGVPNLQVPARFSVSQYVRFEPFIEDAITNWPRPTEWCPTSISLDTFARGLRNSIKSVLAYNWSCANIDIAKLASIWPAAQIFIQPGRVVFASRGTPPVLANDDTPTHQKTSFYLDASDSLAVKAALILLDRKKITLPVILQGDPTETFAYIEQRELDVTVQPAPNIGPDSFLML